MLFSFLPCFGEGGVGRYFAPVHAPCSVWPLAFPSEAQNPAFILWYPTYIMLAWWSETNAALLTGFFCGAVHEELRSLRLSDHLCTSKPALGALHQLTLYTLGTVVRFFATWHPPISAEGHLILGGVSACATCMQKPRSVIVSAKSIETPPSDDHHQRHF